MIKSNVKVRYFLLTGFLLLAMAGCSSNDTGTGAVPEPVALNSPRQCDVCGMVIEQQYGPAGQVFYLDSSSGDDTPPVMFDSIKHGLFPEYFEYQHGNRQVVVVYVSDYSKIKPSVEMVKGEPYIQTAVKSEMFSPASEVVFVVGSNVRGAMGKDFIPFSDRDDAREFTEQYGGKLVLFSDIQRSHLTQ